MRAEKLTITFRFEALSVQFALSGIQSVIRTLKQNSDGFHLDGKVLKDLSDAAPRLRDRGRTNFNLTGNGFEFHLGRVRNCDFDFLLVRYCGDLEFPWDEWAKRFVGEPTFVMAWLADLEYDFWQNADDPLEYEGSKQEVRSPGDEVKWTSLSLGTTDH